jgi:hypothetical protein
MRIMNNKINVAGFYDSLPFAGESKAKFFPALG